MSLFQCDECGCRENTALSSQGIGKYLTDCFNWEGKDNLKGKMLCSACAPDKLKDGTSSGLGHWHGKFERVFLPLGKFKTNGVGNLEHVETGEEDYRKYAISKT